MTFFNVICRKPGAGADRRVVCAHFDSRTKAPLDSKSEAPGANDNATGVAVLLECARLLSQIRLPDTIEFAAVSGEEQGLWGSTRYASDLSHEGARLRFMLNIDEVGFPNAHREVIVEHDTGNHLRKNNRASRELAKDVVAVATHHLGIPAKHAGIVDSDYMPFEARGYVTLGLYESGNYDEFRHTARDTIDGVNFAYVADVTRVALRRYCGRARVSGPQRNGALRKPPVRRASKGERTDPSQQQRRHTATATRTRSSKAGRASQGAAMERSTARGRIFTGAFQHACMMRQRPSIAGRDGPKGLFWPGFAYTWRAFRHRRNT